MAGLEWCQRKEPDVRVKIHKSGNSTVRIQFFISFHDFSTLVHLERCSKRSNQQIDSDFPSLGSISKILRDGL